MGRVTAVDTNPTTDNTESNRQPSHAPAQAEFPPSPARSENPGAQANTSATGSNEGDQRNPGNESGQMGSRRGRYFNRRRRPVRGRRFGGNREEAEPREKDDLREPSSAPPEGGDLASEEQISAKEGSESSPTNRDGTEPSEVASWREDAELIEREHQRKGSDENSPTSEEPPRAEASEEAVGELPSERGADIPESKTEQNQAPATEQPQREAGNRFQRHDRGHRDQRQGQGRHENREQRQGGQNQQRDRDRERNRDRDRGRDRDRNRDRDNDRGDRQDRGERRDEREQRETREWSSYQFQHPGLQELKSNVDKIRSGLETVLRDLDRMLDTLVKAEQDSEIDEDEIEVLRQQIKKMQK